MRLTLLLLISGSLLAAGCGGGDETSSSSTPTPTATATAAGPSKEAWAAEVTSICKENQRESRKVIAEVQGEGLRGDELAVEVLDRSIPYQRRLVDELAAVQAPGEIAEDYDAFVERLRQALPLLRQLRDAVRKPKQYPALEQQFRDLAADTRPFALEHGLRECLPDQS